MSLYLLGGIEVKIDGRSWVDFVLFHWSFSPFLYSSASDSKAGKGESMMARNFCFRHQFHPPYPTSLAHALPPHANIPLNMPMLGVGRRRCQINFESLAKKNTVLKLLLVFFLGKSLGVKKSFVKFGCMCVGRT